MAPHCKVCEEVHDMSVGINLDLDENNVCSQCRENCRFEVKSLKHNGEFWVIEAENEDHICDFRVDDKERLKDNILLDNYISINLFSSHVLELLYDPKVSWDAIMHNPINNGMIFLNFME